MLPWAEALAKQWKDDNFKDDLFSRFCLPCCVELLGDFCLNRIIQRPEILVTLVEGDVPGYRQVFLDGREHPKDIETTWTGHSVGKWEGDVLVVDTVGFNDKTQWPGPHTEMLHVTTRLHRPSIDVLSGVLQIWRRRIRGFMKTFWGDGNALKYFTYADMSRRDFPTRSSEDSASTTSQERVALALGTNSQPH